MGWMGELSALPLQHELAQALPRPPDNGRVTGPAESWRKTQSSQGLDGQGTPGPAQPEGPGQGEDQALRAPQGVDLPWKQGSRSGPQGSQDLTTELSRVSKEEESRHWGGDRQAECSGSRHGGAPSPTPTPSRMQSNQGLN